MGTLMSAATRLEVPPHVRRQRQELLPHDRRQRRELLLVPHGHFNLPRWGIEVGGNVGLG